MAPGPGLAQALAEPYFRPLSPTLLLCKPTSASFNYTSDKAYRDPDGYLWFVGRDDDVITSSDYRIGPFEVESVLLEYPAVAEAAVVGVPHAIKGQKIKAFVLLVPGTAPTATLAHALLAYGRAHLAPYKAPRRLEFVAELPKTISGKIRRVELRARPAGGAAEFSLEKA